MANITLDGNTYDHIVDVDFVEVKTAHYPEWINDETPEIETNVWNLKPLKSVYTLRVTNAEKWILDQILIGHSSVKLTDATYGIANQDVLMIELEAVWEGHINYANPWLVTIELIPC